MQDLQVQLGGAGLDDIKRRKLLQEMEGDKWPFYIDVYAISKLCSGNTCISSDDTVPGDLFIAHHCRIYIIITSNAR